MTRDEMYQRARAVAGELVALADCDDVGGGRWDELVAKLADVVGYRGELAGERHKLYRLTDCATLANINDALQAWCDEARTMPRGAALHAYRAANGARRELAAGLVDEDADWLPAVLRAAEVWVSVRGSTTRRWICPDYRWRRLPEAAEMWRAYVKGATDDDC